MDLVLKRIEEIDLEEVKENALLKMEEIKKEIESLKLEAERASRVGDYAKVAEIQYGKLREKEEDLKKLELEMQNHQNELISGLYRHHLEYCFFLKGIFQCFDEIHQLHRRTIANVMQFVATCRRFRIWVVAVPFTIGQRRVLQQPHNTLNDVVNKGEVAQHIAIVVDEEFGIAGKINPGAFQTCFDHYLLVETVSKIGL